MDKTDIGPRRAKHCYPRLSSVGYCLYCTFPVQRDAQTGEIAPETQVLGLKQQQATVALGMARY